MSDKDRSPAPVNEGGNSDNGDQEVENPGNNLYVANIAHSITEAELQVIFSKYGRLEKCEVIVDPITQESRGFAFVTYEDLRDATDAVQELNGKEFEGRRMRVEHAKRKRGHAKTPGRYLGPKLASVKYGRDRRGGGRSCSRDRGHDNRRSRSRERLSRNYYDRDNYHSRRDDGGGYRGRGGDYNRDRNDGRRSRR